MFFYDKFNVKYNEQTNIVRLSIRSSEERVDEYFLKIKDVQTFCFDFVANSIWFGNRSLQGKIKNKDAYLRVNIHQNVRYTYKMKTRDLQLLHAQLNTLFFDMSTSGGEEVEINDEIEEIIEIDNKKISKDDNSELLNNIMDELNYLRSKINEIDNRKPIEKITETIIEKQIVSEQSVFKDDFEIDNDMPIFIPSKIKTSNLKGNINTQEDDNDFNIETSLEKLNKGEK